MRAKSAGKRGKMSSNEDGFILFTALLVMAILMIIGFTLIVVGINEMKVAGRIAVNDEAYMAAEAGINRALLYMKDNPDFLLTAPPVGNQYWVDLGYSSPTGTPQWEQGTVTPVPFGNNGDFSVEIWQSGRDGETILGNYKVIRATGAVDDKGIIATRVLETRVVIPDIDDEYDACLDYTIFNGNNATAEGVTPTAWPDATNWAGGVTIDGKSPCPLTGRSPRGAVYTRGPIDMDVHLAGNYTIKGNLISTDYITLESTINIAGTMKYDGNVIAGLDPSDPSDPNNGNVDLNLKLTTAGTIQVTGYVAGTGDVDIEYFLNVNNRTLSLGGIISGGRVLVSGVGSIGTNQLGRIHAAGGNASGATVDFTQVATEVRFTSINSGSETHSDDEGVRFVGVGALISGSNIYTDGKFTAITIGLVDANFGNIEAANNISVTTGGLAGFQAASVESGQTISLNAGAALINIASIHGQNISVLSGFGGYNLGTLRAANNINVTVAFGGMNMNGVWAGHDVDLNYIIAGGTTGFISPSDDGVRAGHDVDIFAIGLVAVGDFGFFTGTGDIRYGGSCHTTPLLVWYDDKIHINPGSPGTPVAPAYDEVVPSGTADWLKHTPPVVDEDLMLYMAGLSRPAKIVTPNWQWYKEQAAAQDASGPDIHLIYDGQPGVDLDGTMNGAILIEWVAGSGYSSNEIIYAKNGENIVIDAIDWGTEGALFTGTIVTKGSLYVAYDVGLDWELGTQQTLNIAAGEDIDLADNGFVVEAQTNSNFHFWAGNNIDLSNSTWSIFGEKLFTGSFTAGNRVKYSDNTLWTDTTFTYSRWVVPAEAWLPSYKVLSWREI